MVQGVFPFGQFPHRLFPLCQFDFVVSHFVNIDQMLQTIIDDQSKIGLQQFALTLQ